MSKNLNLYNKYRPNSFQNIIGQELIKNLILQIFNKKKLIQSFLFFGPHGTGKTSIARILAKAWNCLNFKNLDVCNECENCKLINENQTLDVIEIDAASNSGVDFVRDLVQSVQYIPLDLKKKIYIIDEAHNLSNAAWNALLKVIEEPPEYVIFIFLTTNVHKILPTIFSRCQKYNFAFLTKLELSGLIDDIANKENKKITLAAKEKIILFSEGSARQCLTYLEKLFLIYDKEIGLNEVDKTFCLTDKDTVIEFLVSIFNKNFSNAYKIIENLYQTDKNLFYFFSYLLDILSDCILYEKTKNIKFLNNLDKESVEKFLVYKQYFLNISDNLSSSLIEFDSFRNKFQWAKLTIFKIWNIFEDKKEETKIFKEKKISNTIETQEEKINNTLDSEFPLINEIQEIFKDIEKEEDIKVEVIEEENETLDNNLIKEEETTSEPEIINDTPKDIIENTDYDKDEKFTHNDSLFQLKTLSIYSKNINYFLTADLSKGLEQKILYGLKKSQKFKSEQNFDILRQYINSPYSLTELVNIFKKAVHKFGLITSDKTIIIIFNSPTDCHDFSLLIQEQKIKDELKKVFFEEFEWYPLQHILLPRYLKASRASEESKLKKEEIFKERNSKVYFEVLDILEN